MKKRKASILRLSATGKRILLFLIAVCIVIATLRSLREPPPILDKPFAIILELPKRRWKVGEDLWYLYKVKSISPGIIGIVDTFLGVQDCLVRRAKEFCRTEFVILDPDGKPVRPHFDWGEHGEYKFWTSATRRYRPENPRYPREYFWQRWLEAVRTRLPVNARAILMEPWVHDFYAKFGKKTWDGGQLGPGEEITATPSIVAPFRKTRGYTIEDARIGPDTTPEEAQALRKLAGIYSEEIEIITGAKPKVDPYGPREPVYPGLRILDGYIFRKPGLYRMKAYYRTMGVFSPITAEEELRDLEAIKRKPFAGNPISEAERQEIIEKWRTMPPEDYERIKKERQRRERLWLDRYVPESLRAYYIESNLVEFEVVP